MSDDDFLELVEIAPDGTLAPIDTVAGPQSGRHRAPHRRPSRRTQVLVGTALAAVLVGSVVAWSTSSSSRSGRARAAASPSAASTTSAPFPKSTSGVVDGAGRPVALVDAPPLCLGVGTTRIDAMAPQALAASIRAQLPGWQIEYGARSSNPITGDTCGVTVHGTDVDGGMLTVVITAPLSYPGRTTESLDRTDTAIHLRRLDRSGWSVALDLTGPSGRLPANSTVTNLVSEPAFFQ